MQVLKCVLFARYLGLVHGQSVDQLEVGTVELMGGKEASSSNGGVGKGRKGKRNSGVGRVGGDKEARSGGSEGRRVMRKSGAGRMATKRQKKMGKDFSQTWLKQR